MTAITGYARARALVAGVAQPIATVRHLQLTDHPLVVVPLALAGEANAPLAALLGTDPAAPQLLVVPQPRNRSLRFEFAARLADVILPYLEGFSRRAEPVRGRTCWADGPQLVVPNPGGVSFLGLLGRSTRFRRTFGEYPVAPRVPILGQWLTFLADRARYPGSSCLIAMTEALTQHWATGQSALEDANLAAVLGWIDPPPGLSGPAAARLAEDPAATPPAGPATDPDFDNHVLAPAVAAYDQSPPESPARARALTALHEALAGQLRPTWHLTWRGIALLRSLAAAGSVAERWLDDRQRCTAFHEHVSAGGPPQARRDGAIAAAWRLSWLERAQVGYDAARAFDDPLVMAGHRVSGQAFLGTVSTVERDRRVPNRNGNLVTRPRVTLVTADPVHLTPGSSVVAVSRPGQQGTITAIEPAAPGGSLLVTLELSGGMGRAKLPPPGTVPEVGETLCYSGVLPDNVPAPPLPSAEETPWTHGGPPRPSLPTEDDAGELWD